MSISRSYTNIIKQKYDYESIIFFSAKIQNYDIIDNLMDVDNDFVKHIKNVLRLSNNINHYQVFEFLLTNFYQYINISYIYELFDIIWSNNNSLDYYKLMTKYYDIDITHNNYSPIIYIFLDDNLDGLKFIIDNYPEFDIHFDNKLFFYKSVHGNKIFNFLLKNYGSFPFIGKNKEFFGFEGGIKKIKKYFKYGILDVYNPDDLFHELFDNNFNYEVFDFFIKKFPNMKYELDIDKTFIHICDNKNYYDLKYLLENFSDNKYDWEYIIDDMISNNNIYMSFINLFSQYIKNFDITYKNNIIMLKSDYGNFEILVNNYYSDKVEELKIILENNESECYYYDFKISYLKKKMNK